MISLDTLQVCGAHFIQMEPLAQCITGEVCVRTPLFRTCETRCLHYVELILTTDNLQVQVTSNIILVIIKKELGVVLEQPAKQSVPSWCRHFNISWMCPIMIPMIVVLRGHISFCLFIPGCDCKLLKRLVWKTKKDNNTKLRIKFSTCLCTECHSLYLPCCWPYKLYHASYSSNLLIGEEWIHRIQWTYGGSNKTNDDNDYFSHERGGKAIETVW